MHFVSMYRFCATVMNKKENISYQITHIICILNIFRQVFLRDDGVELAKLMLFLGLKKLVTHIFSSDRRIET
jgi:hypothetical protein